MGDRAAIEDSYPYNKEESPIRRHARRQALSEQSTNDSDKC